MSGWDAYITSLTGSNANITRAAILGAADGSVWARTMDAKTFKASDKELKAFVELFKNVSSAPSIGADLEEIHYIVPRAEDNYIFGKKDKTGFFAVKTNQAVIVALFEGESHVSAEVRLAVEKIADYLKTNGY